MILLGALLQDLSAIAIPAIAPRPPPAIDQPGNMGERADRSAVGVAAVRPNKRGASPAAGGSNEPDQERAFNAATGCARRAEPEAQGQ
jgi:hypothetical protein